MPFGRRVMQVVWPAFLTAAAAELLFFAVFDPFELHFFGVPLDFSRESIYAMGFFGFWGLGIASSALTLYLAHADLADPDANGEERGTRMTPD